LIAGVAPDATGSPGGMALAPTLLAGRQWVGIVESVPNSVFMAPAAAIRNTSLIVGLVAMLCAAVLAVIVARSLTLCHSCHFDLRKASASAGREADGTEVRFQQKLLAGVAQGWIEIRAGERVYSLLYFAALHQVMRLLATGPKAELIRNEVSRLCGIKPLTSLFSGKRGRDIERLNVARRRDLLVMADYLLRDWPERFITFCGQHRVWSSTLLKDFEHAPFWYWQVIHEHLQRTSYCPSDEEVRSAIRYIDRIGRAVCKKAISKCLGVDDAFRKRKSKLTFDLEITNLVRKRGESY